MSDKPQDEPKVRVIVINTPMTGAYETDGDGVYTIELDPDDDVRLKFDGEKLLFEDWKVKEE